MDNVQNILLWDVPTITERHWMLSRDNPNCPFSKFVGNDKAIRRLSRALFMALGRENRSCSDQSFALLGPASTGKTTIVKMFADTLGLPLVKILPKSVKSLVNVLTKIGKVCEETWVEGVTLELKPLKPYPGYPRLDYFEIPPCVVFIDEVHSLSNDIVQGLLTATESKDRLFVTENGLTVNCKNICWVIATTDRGKLFDAFDTRFTKINLNLYTREEMAKIVKINNKDWSMDVCRLIAKYGGRIPREVLAFATEMKHEYEMNPYDNWLTIAQTVAKDNDIDEHGMTLQRVGILKSLGQGTIAKKQMSTVAGCKEEELEKYIMPSLLAKIGDELALVAITSRGYSITESGLIELDKRGILHKGQKAMAAALRTEDLQICLN